jgi:hypothetical protein
VTRSATLYSDGGTFTAPDGYGVSVNPVAGFYRTRLRSGAHPVGIKIWYGPPLDPDTGEEMDRGYRWQAYCNDSYIELDRVWPNCGGDPIDQTEYAYLCDVQRWGEQNASSGPQANPYRPVNLLTAPFTI